MEVYKHKITGKFFIFLNEVGIDRALLITPQCKIKTLNIDQFSELEDENKNYLLSEGLISELQIKKFEQYKKDRSDDEIENFLHAFKLLSTYGKIRFFRGLPISQSEKEKLLKKIKKGLI